MVHTSMNPIAFALALVAAVLAVIVLVQSRARSLDGWAILAISVAVIIQHAFTYHGEGVHF